LSWARSKPRWLHTLRCASAAVEKNRITRIRAERITKLIAYVVLHDDCRNFIKNRVARLLKKTEAAEYMVPASFIFLDSLPLPPAAS